MKYNLLFNIYYIKNDNIKSRIKKIYAKLVHELDDTINLNDIKRIKSSAFNDENYIIL